MVEKLTRVPNMVLTQKSSKTPKVLFSKPLQKYTSYKLPYKIRGLHASDGLFISGLSKNIVGLK